LKIINLLRVIINWEMIRHKVWNIKKIEIVNLILGLDLCTIIIFCWIQNNWDNKKLVSYRVAMIVIITVLKIIGIFMIKNLMILKI
jgi:hypothetical protein